MALISFVSLGCDKNLVDSEVMIGLLKEAGHVITGDESEAEVIVINTCSFIEDALTESIENIIELGKMKKNGKLKAIVAAGCLTERYKDEIFSELPETDVILGTTSYESIVEAVHSALFGGERSFFADINLPCDEEKSLKRELSTTGSYYGYLKIAEGCDNFCTYCIIPSLRGKYRSRTLESLLAEAKILADSGVSELVVVAQDTSRYGLDLYGEIKLPELLNRLSEIEDIKWIRLMYCYPENIGDDLIDVIKNNDKVCKYLDMPIQHISDSVLKRMGRKTSGNDIRALINKLRREIDGIAIRTSLIVGFPGENDDDFNELLDFVESCGLERVGVFAFSKEEGTPAAKMKNTVNKKTRLLRRNKIMRTQLENSKAFLAKLVGKRIAVIVDGKIAGEDIYLCRSYMDAPAVDSTVYVSCDEELLSGDFIEAEIVGYHKYDSIGAYLRRL